MLFVWGRARIVDARLIDEILKRGETSRRGAVGIVDAYPGSSHLMRFRESW
jgi:hypothetical protein